MKMLTLVVDYGSIKHLICQGQKANPLRYKGVPPVGKERRREAERSQPTNKESIFT